MTTTIALTLDEGRIDEIFADLIHDGEPGATVGIAVAGLPAYRKAFGRASLELPILLMPSTRMHIGSASKHFVVLAYLLMCEEGLARLDDPLGLHLPDCHPSISDATVRHLMAHTSGIVDAYELIGFVGDNSRAHSCSEIVNLYREISHDVHVANRRWNYNNGAYYLISTIVERLAGKTLAEVLNERIFLPVGMSSTELRKNNRSIAQDCATLHMGEPGAFNKNCIEAELSGAGGIISTVDDMLRWLAHMDSPRIGSSSSWEAMRAPVSLSNGVSTNYGLGLRVEPYRGLPVISHPGGLLGGNAQMLKVPSAALDIVIMTNRHDVSAVSVANAILDCCMPDLEPIDPPPQKPARIGVYRSGDTGRVVQLQSRNNCQAVLVDGFEIPITERGDRLVATGTRSYLRYELELVGNGETPSILRLFDFGNEDRLDLVAEADPSDARKAVGRFHSNECQVSLSIESVDGGLKMSVTGPYGAPTYRLEPVARGVWQPTSTDSVPAGGLLSLNDDGSQLRFSSFRLREHRFVRVAGCC